MKNLTLLLIVLPLFFSSQFVLSSDSITTLHESDEPARSAVHKICDSLSFSSDRSACYQIASSATYFNLAAVELCKNLSFRSYTLDCLSAISGRDYDRQELQTCDRISFTSDQIRCLKNLGRNYLSRAQEKLRETSRRLRVSLDLLRQKDYDALKTELEALLDIVDSH